jgi:small GTP-binding protein
MEELPAGVKLVRVLKGHTDMVYQTVWSPDGRTLASASNDRTVGVWDGETGERLHRLEHEERVYCVAFDPAGRILASGSHDARIKLWQPGSGKLLCALTGHGGWISCVAFDPAGRTLASSGLDGSIKLWEADGGKLLRSLEAHQVSVFCVAFDPTGRSLASASADGTIRVWKLGTHELLHTLAGHTKPVYSVAFDPTGHTVASGSDDCTVKLWESGSGKLVRTLEGHTKGVKAVTFHSGGQFLVTRGLDAIRLWRCSDWQQIASIDEPINVNFVAISFHPVIPALVTTGSDGASASGPALKIYELDLKVLLGQAAAPAVNYTSAKIVLLGDSGVGKTGLGWRLANDEFKEHASTHGQQFWLLKQLSGERRDGAQCEAVLWDLGGQDDYRLIHALFVDDADLALVLFDPSRHDEVLSGAEFWKKQLKETPAVLVAARSDRGTPRMSRAEIEAFCRERGFHAYLLTSARDGIGIDDLLANMQELVRWDDKPATVTTETFKRIKDYVLGLKEGQDLILTPEGLRERLEQTDPDWKFSDVEMLTAVGHLENHGYVKRLKTSRAELRILLAPEVLNNLAASFILSARANPKDLGSLEEEKLLARGYPFPELEKVGSEETDMLVDSAEVLFLEHHVCFRETDPLNERAYLVFPELINLKKPLVADEVPTEDGVAYTVTGAVENVYASLVVLMGYTDKFTRTNQWRNQSRYVVGKGFVCGFRQEDERPGELDFVLYFGTDTPAAARTVFQGLFESFLGRKDVAVQRIEPVVCANGHVLNRAVVRQQMAKGFAFCAECGDKVALPKEGKPIAAPKGELAIADRRSRFEQVLFRLKAYATDQKIHAPECFVSYSWGNAEQERWVEKSLATDLQKAGVAVVLDRWENARIGASVPRFVERVAKSAWVIVVGTPEYRRKYENGEAMRGFVVAAEGDLIGERMMGTEAQKERVLPALLEGTKESSFPAVLRPRVYADFRKSETYFEAALELLLTLYGIGARDPVAVELRSVVRGAEELGRAARVSS